MFWEKVNLLNKRVLVEGLSEKVVVFYRICKKMLLKFTISWQKINQDKMICLEGFFFRFDCKALLNYS